MEIIDSKLKGKRYSLKMYKKKLQLNVSNERFVIGFQMLNQWLRLQQNGKTLVSFFKDNLIKTIAIYGMGALGERLYDELNDGKIVVKYAIDRIAESKSRSELKIYNSNADSFPETDVIVVTPVQDYWEIVKLLEKKSNAAILSLKDIIDYCAIEENK